MGSFRMGSMEILLTVELCADSMVALTRPTISCLKQGEPCDFIDDTYVINSNLEIMFFRQGVAIKRANYIVGQFASVYSLGL